MSQVPNRYYNSPWIADAARNLSLAIGGDPERDAARLQQEQIRANMARQTDADILERENRQKLDLANNLTAELIAMSPEDKAGRQAKFSDIIRVAGPQAPYMKAGGDLNPDTESRAYLQGLKHDYDIQSLGQRLTAMSEDKRKDRESREGMHADDNEFKYYNANNQFRIAKLHDETKERIEKLRDKDGKPLNIPIGAKNQLLSIIADMGETAGGSIPDSVLNDIFVDSTMRWQDTRNPFVAARQAFEKKYGPQPKTRSGKKGAWPWSANQPDELVPLEEQEQAPAAGATTPTASAPEQDGGFLDALSSIVSGAITSAPASNPASRPGTPAASPGTAPLSSAITRPAPRAFGGRGVTYVEPTPINHGRGVTAPPVAAPSAPTTPAAQTNFAPPSPAAEKYLQANPTKELKAAFQSKYGYLPPGL